MAHCKADPALCKGTLIECYCECEACEKEFEKERNWQEAQAARDREQLMDTWAKKYDDSEGRIEDTPEE